jgi:type VI protein secretion system component Hcp
MPTFIQIPNVTGEATAEGFTGQFEIGGLLWGGGSILIAGIKRSFTTSLSAVTVSKLGRRNSPTLMVLMANRKNLGSVVITIVKQANSKNLPIHVYTLSNAMMASLSQGSDGLVPIEDMTFTYSRLTYQQIYYDSAGVKTGDETHYWDVTLKKGG